jgi:macrolide transport system ATP-binding/permease protein
MLTDLRYAIRMLLKNPGVSVAAVISLALGIGANAIIFTWVKAVLLEPLPGVARQRDLVVVANQTKDGDYVSMSYPDYRDYRDKTSSFDGLLVAEMMPLSLGGAIAGERAERLYGAFVSGNYFDVLGVRAALGRTFRPDEDRVPNGAPVAVISDGLWKRRFGGDMSLVGRVISINGHPYSIVGIAPPAFQGTLVGVALDVWVPVMMQPQLTPGGDRLEARGLRWLIAMGRLKGDVSIPRAQAELDIISGQLTATYPNTNNGFGIRVLPLSRSPWGAQFVLGPVLTVLMGVVGAVLLLACTNVANLLLAQALARRREVAIRLAIGASRTRLARQMLVESFILAILGGVAGVAVASFGASLLMAFAPPTDIPIKLSLTVDFMVVAFTGCIALATGLLFGLVPALQGTRPDVVDDLKDEAGSSGGRSRARLRNSLVIVQVALSVLMLVAAGVFVRSFQNAQTMDPGFNREGVLLASYDLFPNGYEAPAGRQFHRRLAERVAALPGVTAAALARRVPLGFFGSSSTRIAIDDYVPDATESMQISYNMISPDYFRTMRVPLLAGREFTPRDDENDRPVVIVNAAMAHRYWKRTDVVGRQIRVGGTPWEIVGVVPTGKYQTLGEQARSYMFVPLAQMYRPDAVLHVRTAGDPSSIAGAVRGVVADLDPNLPLFDVKTLHAHMGFATLTPRVAASLLGTFGILALILAAVGLNSVVAYSVSQRTREVAIRMALGARPSDVRTLIVRQGLTLLVIGLVVGVAIAYGTLPLMSSLLIGISGRDPLTFASVGALLSAVALVASYLPARRAARVDPIATLRR